MKDFRLGIYRIIIFAWLVFVSCQQPKEENAIAVPTPEEINDAYIYLLSRYLIIQQENVDININKTNYNEFRHNPLGDYSFVNPNMDVAISEAWIAVDDSSVVVVNIPKIDGRYYTAQIIDSWGEVITNLNERMYPEHPDGAFAFVTKGSTVKIPEGALRIEIPGTKAKVLTRVQLKNDNEGALALQRKFTIAAPAGIKISQPIQIPDFSNTNLISVAIFDKVKEVLNSQPDFMPNAEKYQAIVNKVSAYTNSNKAARETTDSLLVNKVIPNFLEGSKGFGSQKDGWSISYVLGNSGGDIVTRAILNYGGIWGNVKSEVLYFIGLTDNNKELLSGDHVYEIKFPKGSLPEEVVNSYWALTLYSVPDYRIVPNNIDRFGLGSASNLKKNKDGSLSIWVASEKPTGAILDNWLPSPKGKGFALTLRIYVPKDLVKNGEWFPSAIVKKN
ncbi:MAG: DUF1254 domain-containing protein [Cyclobacteriaceae bacterium]|nr:DUF1254 domain-containing protein [Cyclobacteriaceae bacterium]